MDNRVFLGADTQKSDALLRRAAPWCCCIGLLLHHPNCSTAQLLLQQLG